MEMLDVAAVLEFVNVKSPLLAENIDDAAVLMLLTALVPKSVIAILPFTVVMPLRVTDPAVLRVKSPAEFEALRVVAVAVPLVTVTLPHTLLAVRLVAFTKNGLAVPPMSALFEFRFTLVAVTVSVEAACVIEPVPRAFKLMELVCAPPMAPLRVTPLVPMPVSEIEVAELIAGTLRLPVPSDDSVNELAGTFLVKALRLVLSLVTAILTSPVVPTVSTGVLTTMA